MSFGSFLFGKKARTQQFSPYSKDIQGLLNSNLMQGLQGMNRFDFAPIEQAARTQFNTQTVPSLAERFTSMGDGAQRSSAFQGALGQAGAGLEEQLAAMKQNYNLQQQNQLMNMLGMSRQENMYQPSQPGFLEQMAGPLTRMGLGLGSNAMARHGLYGRGMMDMVNGNAGEASLNSLGNLASLLMFL